MKVLNRTITATSNERKRHFTLYVSYKDGSKTKYRTTKMSKEEFEDCKNNTSNDWEQFLKSDDYYKI